MKEVREAERMDKETTGGSKDKEVELGDSLAYIPEQIKVGRDGSLQPSHNNEEMDF